MDFKNKINSLNIDQLISLLQATIIVLEISKIDNEEEKKDAILNLIQAIFDKLLNRIDIS